MSAKLIFTDIDGTLLNHHQQLPDSARAALRTLAERGHTVVLATGRPLPEMYPWLFELGCAGFVGGGGSYGQVAEQVVFEHLMPRADMLAAQQFFEQHGVDYVWQASTGLVTSQGFIDRIQAASGTQLGHDWSELAELYARVAVVGAPERASKAVFVCAEDAELNVAAVRERFSGVFEVIRGSVDAFGPHNGELLIPGVNKGTALREMAEHLGFSLADTIAIGDSDNDLEMVQLAGTGIAMGNARASLKAAADLVTAPVDEDGFARAFADLGLI